MLSRNNDHCARPLSVPAAALHFPFCQRNFFRGLLFRTTANTIPPLSRDVSALLGHESPFLVLLELGSAEEGRCGRKQRRGAGGLSGTGKGRIRAGRVVRRLRRKCQRKWLLCLDGSVSWPRKPPFSTPEGRRAYVSSHT